MSFNFFRGTSSDQDFRFNGKKAKEERRALKASAPANFKTKVCCRAALRARRPSRLADARRRLQVDLKKVNMEVMHEWIAKRVNGFLGFEDEVLVDTIFNTIQPVRRAFVVGSRLPAAC